MNNSVVALGKNYIFFSGKTENEVFTIAINVYIRIFTNLFIYFFACIKYPYIIRVPGFLLLAEEYLFAKLAFYIKRA